MSLSISNLYTEYKAQKIACLQKLNTNDNQSVTGACA